MSGADAKSSSGSRSWELACMALRILAVDPPHVGGVVLRSAPGPVRDEWLQALRSALPPATPWCRMPAGIGDERLLGGLDLAATLRSGKPIIQSGLLRQADGGVLVLAMAERIEDGVAARVAGVLDQGSFRLERDGFAAQLRAQIGCVALDESCSDEQQVPAALLHRLPLLLDFADIGLADFGPPVIDPVQLANARQLLPTVDAPEQFIEALCGTALVLGIESVRAPLMALRVARVCAALAGRDCLSNDDVSLAAALVLAPRATCLPADSQSEPEPPPPPEQTNEQRPTDGQSPPPTQEQTQQPEPLQEQILAATKAVVPADLLLQWLARNAAATRQRSQGRRGALFGSRRRGRPAGVRQSVPRAGQRLSVIDTLRAAAPWQRLRRAALAGATHSHQRVLVRSEDFHVRRYKQRSETATVFIIDASGSAALTRLAEAKGAIELLLAQCYIRRDQVAVIAFRGRGAELLLPPTRSLVRAKRSLAGLPGGGGTPLAAGIEAGTELAASLQRAGLTPTLVLLTDGRGNVTRAGIGHREQATAEAVAASHALRRAGHRVLLLDTGARPQPQAAQLAVALGALYLPLPNADATVLAQAVQRASPTLLRRAAP